MEDEPDDTERTRPLLDHLPKIFTETKSFKERRIASGGAGCALRIMKTRYRSHCIPIRRSP
jgi:hypothetical protein